MQYALSLSKNLDNDDQQKVYSLLDSILEVFAENAPKNIEPPKRHSRQAPFTNRRFKSDVQNMQNCGRMENLPTSAAISRRALDPAMCHHRGYCQLHGFCEAAERAFASAVYLHTKGATCQVQTQLLITKTIVYPFKTVQIPTVNVIVVKRAVRYGRNTKVIDPKVDRLNKMSLFQLKWKNRAFVV